MFSWKKIQALGWTKWYQIKHTVILWFLNHKDHPSASKYYTILFWNSEGLFVTKVQVIKNALTFCFPLFSFSSTCMSSKLFPFLEFTFFFRIQKTLGPSKWSAESGAFLFFLDTIVTKQRMECACAVFNQSQFLTRLTSLFIRQSRTWHVKLVLSSYFFQRKIKDITI